MTFHEDTPLPSPCIGICKLDSLNNECIGCLRTKAQITDWGKLDHQGRLEIITIIKAKRDQRLGIKRKNKRNLKT